MWPFHLPEVESQTKKATKHFQLYHNSSEVLYQNQKSYMIQHFHCINVSNLCNYLEAKIITVVGTEEKAQLIRTKSSLHCMKTSTFSS